jgi:hypothetical protein
MEETGMSELLADVKARQITRESSLIGKTISACFIDTYGPMTLRFTDSTWARVVVDRGWEGDAGVLLSSDIPALHDLCHTGLLSEEAYQSIREASWQRHEADERAEYEKLKAKYG